MGEWRLQPSDYPSTFEYHKDRERAPHLEQPHQAHRIYKAVEMIRRINPSSVVDFGCGDGGLLSLIKDIPSWGYDFHPASQAGWVERNVEAYSLDVFNDLEASSNFISWAELAVLTEVLEHVKDPHGVVRFIAHNVKYIVASSPVNERPDGHDPDCHIFAWDFEGYEDLLSPHFKILYHELSDWSQVIAGRSQYV